MTIESGVQGSPFAQGDATALHTKEFVIDLEGFKSIVKGATQAAMTRDQIQTLRNQANDLNRKAQELNAQLSRDAAYRSLEQLTARAKNAKGAKLADRSRTIYINETELRTLIERSLDEIGVKSTPGQIDTVLRQVKDTVARLLHE
jgi:hypothetical protein